MNHKPPPQIDPKNVSKSALNFDRLLRIMERLRDPEAGCPWDREQSHLTLRPLLLEETYEVFDAVDCGPKELAGELGDVFSILALFCQIGADEKTFTAEDALSAIIEKLIRRHPHVFGSANADGSEAVMKQWEAIKQEERKGTREEGVLSGVPKSMPALARAQRVSEKCARVGFEWPTFDEIKDKVLEEVNEFVSAVSETPDDRERQADEFGDIFFSLVQLARRSGFNAEELLVGSTNKFIRRFQAIEALAKEHGNEDGVKGLSLEEMDALWNEVKRKG